MHLLAQRVFARLGVVPVPRLRRILLSLFLLAAFGDAAGKALATSPAVRRVLVKHAPGDSATLDLRAAARPSGNFEIFRLSSLNLVAGQNLYAEYPDEHSDRFKYSPTFALLFSPFAILPWPLALFLWSVLNALLLFVAVERVLPPRAALLAQALLLLEVLRAMQNAQSNGLIAGLIILAFSALERARAWRAATAVVLGVCVKIFPLAALTFAIPRRLAMRTGAWAVLIGASFVALPLFVTTPSRLLAQYGWWRSVESSDAPQRWFSVMELVYRWTGSTIPNWPIQLAGTLLLVAPLALRRARWDEARFRFLYLCSVLLYVVLFNHQAERASYVIAFTGATLWFAGEPRARWRTALYGVALLTIPVLSTLVPSGLIPWYLMRSPTAMLYRLAVPSLAIWLGVQFELLRARQFPLQRERPG